VIDRDLLDISVVTINYNDEQGVVRTLESLINQQKYLPKEFIFVDGNSNDNSLKSFNLYEEKLKRAGVIVKWISEDDKGLYYAMNKGLSLVSMPYVWFMNSGDAFCINSMDLISSHLKLNCDFIFGDFYRVSNNNKNSIYVKSRPMWWHKLGMITSHQSMIFNSAIIRDAELNFDVKYKLSSDYDFISRYSLCLRKGKIVKIGEPLCQFDVTGISNSRRYDALKENYNVRRESLNMNFLFAGLLYCAHYLHTIFKNKLPKLAKLLRGF
jgi:putative colanic acid biosynthesis glycosyltransferase